MSITTITSKGQIVIPAKIRLHYGLGKGTKISIEERRNEIVLKPLTEAYLDEITGILKTKGKLSERLLQDRKEEKGRGT